MKRPRKNPMSKHDREWVEVMLKQFIKDLPRNTLAELEANYRIYQSPPAYLRDIDPDLWLKAGVALAAELHRRGLRLKNPGPLGYNARRRADKERARLSAQQERAMAEYRRKAKPGLPLLRSNPSMRIDGGTIHGYIGDPHNGKSARYETISDISGRVDVTMKNPLSPGNRWAFSIRLPDGRERLVYETDKGYDVASKAWEKYLDKYPKAPAYFYFNDRYNTQYIAETKAYREMVNAQGKLDNPGGNYEYMGGGVDTDGWYKISLRRDDGKIIKVGKTRYKSLKAAGRIIDNSLSKNPGVRPAVRIGRQVTAVEYLDEDKARAENLRNPGTPWRHDYKNNSGAEVLGVDNGAVVIAPKGTRVVNMPDGSAIIKGKAKRKLWGYR